MQEIYISEVKDGLIFDEYRHSDVALIELLLEERFIVAINNIVVVGYLYLHACIADLDSLNDGLLLGGNAFFHLACAFLALCLKRFFKEGDDLGDGLVFVF